MGKVYIQKKRSFSLNKDRLFLFLLEIKGGFIYITNNYFLLDKVDQNRLSYKKVGIFYRSFFLTTFIFKKNIFIQYVVLKIDTFFFI